MGYIEIFRMNDEGAGWVDLSEATPQEMLDLEIGLFQEGALWDKSQTLCGVSICKARQNLVKLPT